RRLAGASTRITLHQFPPAGHTRAWNDDPLRYEALVASFVADVLGQPDPGASDVTTELIGTSCTN
ncbi:MAG: hypothetical protein HOH95_10435, partial [Dehalococcoidia bacterium]|nr:hypothetical protein [Dehalococcoidia bacterium]